MGLYFHRVVVGVFVLGSWSGVVLGAVLVREWVWFEALFCVANSC